MRKEKPDFPFMYLMSSTFERKTNDDVGISSMARGARNFQKKCKWEEEFDNRHYKNIPNIAVNFK